MPDIVPMIAYEDGVAALEWLARAFGFRERTRMLGPNGELAHGELETGDGLIMLATPSPDYQSPKHHRQHCEPARQWSRAPVIIDGVLVVVDDLDAHYARAREAGAGILSEPEEGGAGRQYRAED
ncbi:MAG: VOC family protein, partial [Anaerolineales bacterium]